MFKKLIRGFGIILKAELLMWIILLTLAGIIRVISQGF
jgi:hypothetical protein